jgi:hypothetical protein
VLSELPLLAMGLLQLCCLSRTVRAKLEALGGSASLCVLWASNHVVHPIKIPVKLQIKRF